MSPPNETTVDPRGFTSWTWRPDPEPSPIFDRLVRQDLEIAAEDAIAAAGTAQGSGDRLEAKRQLRNALDIIRELDDLDREPTP
ncbi:hypothetical protein [Arthrobacter sp. HLT1-21]